MAAHLILFYKPFGVLSQFTREGKWQTLADFGPFPKSVYPAGRLDAESEGLLLLTDDNRITHMVTDPRFGHRRTYVAQVERIPNEGALGRLREGVKIEGRKTLPASVRLLPAEPDLPPRPVPIRFRKSVPTACLEISLTEGKNRQVRKMTAAVGHPTLRLVRTSIGSLTLQGLAPGQWRNATQREREELLSAASTQRAYRPPSSDTSGSPVSKSKSVSRRSRK
ncbi:MAG TPA: pseudouridine synthase [Bacteroidota bacterium]|nr:pseudouridine synthase [Bacteroidota bacterium]